jgi:hypothetical protein
MWNGRGRGTRRALVVGIDDYPGTARDLPSCVADARFAAAMLRDTFHFDDLIELHDSQATLESVSRSLGLLLSRVAPEDRIVFYYSGHGTQTVRNGELRESLVLHDLLLHDDVLVAATQDLKPGVFTVVLDACFSGGMSKRLDATRIKSTAVVEKSAERLVAYRPFGCHARPNDGPIPAARKSLCVKAAAGEPQLNALLVSACLENETAAASTPATEELSAFTYALGKAIAALGTDLAVEAVLERVIEILHDIGIAQSPQLHPPSSPPMNARTAFLVQEVHALTTGVGDPFLLRVMTAALNALRPPVQQGVALQNDCEPRVRSQLLEPQRPFEVLMTTGNGNAYSALSTDKDLTPAIAQSMVNALRGVAAKGVDVQAPSDTPSLTSFATTLDHLISSSPELKRAVEETLARSARQALALGEGPVPSTDELLAALRTPPVARKGGTYVRGDFWGFYIKVSHEDLGVFLATAVPLTVITATLAAGIWPPAAPFIGLAAAFIAGMLALLKALDRGNGVYINMSWFAPGIFVPTMA